MNEPKTTGTPVYPAGNDCKCQNCDWTGPIDALSEPAKLWERLNPGEPMPLGDCPKCGAFVIPEDPGEKALGAILSERDELRRRLDNERATGDADRNQLERFVKAVNAAMPHFRSAMGGEADHAELAVGQLIVERNTLREACKEALTMAEGLRKATGDAIPGGICWTLRTALASLYEEAK